MGLLATTKGQGTNSIFWVQLNVQMKFVTYYYYTASSVSVQDEPNPVL